MKLEDFGIDPRTKNHNGRLTHAESIFTGILWIDCVGEENAIPADELAIVFANALSGREIDRAELSRLKFIMTSTVWHRRQLDLWKRDVRRMHNHLLKDHSRIPILSRAGHGGGYWIAESEAEVHAFYDAFRKRGLTGLVKASRGKKAVLVDMVRQLSFDFGLEDKMDLAPVRPESDVSMPVEVVDQFLERMLSQPEKFAGDIRKISRKFGVLFSKSQAQAMKAKVDELNDILTGLAE